jgi:hypothetical protein
MSSSVETEPSSPTSSPPSQASPSSMPASPAVVVAGMALSGAALWMVWDAWKSGLIPDYRYALAAITLIMLPAGVLMELGRFAIGLIGRRFGANGK